MGRSEYEVRLEGAVLSIEGDIDLQDVGRGAIRFKATVAGETFEGKIALILGDETFDLAARGRRVAKGGLSGEVILEGVWDLVITMPDGETAAGEMTVTREGDGPWIARMQTDLGLAQIKDIVVEGNRIRFETTVDLGGVKVGLKFSGTTGGGALKGNATVIIEGAPLDFTVDGKLRGRHPN
jgi:hypothetical protein